MSSAQISREGLLQMVQGGDGRTDAYIEEHLREDGRTEYIVHSPKRSAKEKEFNLIVPTREIAETILNGDLLE